MALSGAVHHKQSAVEHNQKGPIWTLDRTHTESTSSSQGPKSAKSSRKTEDSRNRSGRSDACHATGAGVMGQTHQLQTLSEREQGLAWSHASSHYAPHKKVRSQEVQAFQSPRGCRACKFLPWAASSLEDTQYLPCQVTPPLYWDRRTWRKLHRTPTWPGWRGGRVGSGENTGHKDTEISKLVPHSLERVFECPWLLRTMGKYQCSTFDGGIRKTEKRPKEERHLGAVKGTKEGQEGSNKSHSPRHQSFDTSWNVQPNTAHTSLLYHSKERFYP